MSLWGRLLSWASLPMKWWFLWHLAVLGLQLCSLSTVSHQVLTQIMEACLGAWCKHHNLRFLWRFQLSHHDDLPHSYFYFSSCLSVSLIAHPHTFLRSCAQVQELPKSLTSMNHPIPWHQSTETVMDKQQHQISSLFAVQQEVLSYTIRAGFHTVCWQWMTCKATVVGDSRWPKNIQTGDGKAVSLTGQVKLWDHILSQWAQPLKVAQDHTQILLIDHSDLLRYCITHQHDFL